MRQYVLGIDIGSGSIKLTLLGDDGKIGAVAGCEYPTVYPKVGWAEQDPEAVSYTHLDVYKRQLLW